MSAVNPEIPVLGASVKIRPLFALFLNGKMKTGKTETTHIDIYIKKNTRTYTLFKYLLNNFSSLVSGFLFSFLANGGVDRNRNFDSSVLFPVPVLGGRS